MTNQLRKAGANWVDGDRFFDRADELAALTDRVGDGTHTLLTAQRRMGKTSLVRELLRRLDGDGAVTTVFVDLEGANDAADAVAEIAIQAKPVQSAWERIGDAFANHPREVRDHVDEVGLADLRVKLRAGIDAGSWQRSGDRVFEALAANDEPVVLAIDELPILVNRLLKGQDYRITPERREAADQFLSWLRGNGQRHRGKVCMIISGSIGLEPILRQASLSAQMNIFAPFDLQPWSQDTAMRCRRSSLGHTASSSPRTCGRICVTDSAAACPTTCNSSSTTYTSICAEPVPAGRRLRMSSRSTGATFWASAGRSIWSTTRADSGWLSARTDTGRRSTCSRKRR